MVVERAKCRWCSVSQSSLCGVKNGAESGLERLLSRTFAARLKPARHPSGSFWTNYFAHFEYDGAVNTIDGPGLLDGFVASARIPLAHK